jgi:predicted nucleic acid-binding Zn ribbon protein
VLSCKEHCLILNQPYEFRRNVYFVWMYLFNYIILAIFFSVYVLIIL